MHPAGMIELRPEVLEAVRGGRPVVALESSLIAHGLPWPLNLETARDAEAAVRAEGAVPATIAVLEGRPSVGLNGGELEKLAAGQDILKAARRDLAPAIVHKCTAATTVSATMFLAHQAGIRILATGGIGGVHRPLFPRGVSVPRNPLSPRPLGERGGGEGWDISADLRELARTPVAVVCAGAKSILDIPRTLEQLETLGVPVVGYGTDEFPGFYLRTSGRPVSARVNAPEQAAALLAAHWSLDGAGVVLAQPLPEDVALEPKEFEAALLEAESQAAANGVQGKELTPFLLARLAEITNGKTLRANQALVTANARLAAKVSKALVTR